MCEVKRVSELSQRILLRYWSNLQYEEDVRWFSVRRPALVALTDPLVFAFRLHSSQRRNLLLVTPLAVGNLPRYDRYLNSKTVALVLYIALWLTEWCDRCFGGIQSDGSYLNGMTDALEWCDRSVGVIQSDGSYLNGMTDESVSYPRLSTTNSQHIIQFCYAST
jgi:hypothetical protein